jgi:hypothetical protein
MAAPERPYATSDMVALFQQNLLVKATDFSPITPLPKTTIDQYIQWVSVQVELKFSEAGFYLPFAVISGETWPEHQTSYLQLLTCLGVSSLISAGLRPAPALGPGQPATSGNIFQDKFNNELMRIYDPVTKIHNIRFRANYMLGTAAEKSLTEPAPPATILNEGETNKVKWTNLNQYTCLAEELKHQLQVDQLDYTALLAYESEQF